MFPVGVRKLASAESGTSVTVVGKTVMGAPFVTCRGAPAATVVCGAVVGGTPATDAVFLPLPEEHATSVTAATVTKTALTWSPA